MFMLAGYLIFYCNVCGISIVMCWWGLGGGSLCICYYEIWGCFVSICFQKIFLPKIIALACIKCPVKLSKFDFY